MLTKPMKNAVMVLDLISPYWARAGSKLRGLRDNKREQTGNKLPLLLMLKILNSLKSLARPEGFEPPTHGFVALIILLYSYLILLVKFQT
jgi:hypothetical protein